MTKESSTPSASDALQKARELNNAYKSVQRGMRQEHFELPVYDYWQEIYTELEKVTAERDAAREFIEDQDCLCCQDFDCKRCKFLASSPEIK